MFTKLTDASKAAIFAVLVLVMAVGAALLIRILELTSTPGMWVLWSCTPAVAALIMLLVVYAAVQMRRGRGWGRITLAVVL
jgi:hypothetical protein